MTKLSSKRSKSGAAIKFAWATMQGWRAKMEDYVVVAPDIAEGFSFYAVLDGHAGKFAAEHSSKALPVLLGKHIQLVLDSGLSRGDGESWFDAVKAAARDAFVEQDIALAKAMHLDKILPPPRGGTTVTGVLATPDAWIFVNCGDSRTVFLRDDELAFISEDHKPDGESELSRIRSCGGSVIRGRVNGTLAVSRALGDFAYKTTSTDPTSPPTAQVVSPLPDCTVVPRTTADDFMVLASDGLWDVLRPQSMMGFFQDSMRLHRGKGTAAEAACRGAIQQSLRLGSYDNMSVLFVASGEATGIPLAQLETATPVVPAENPSPQPEPPAGPSALTRSLTITSDGDGNDN